MSLSSKYSAIVMGTSAGGLFSLSYLLEALPQKYPIPLIIVQHRVKDQRVLLEELLQTKSAIRIKQADEKEAIENGVAYIAPPDYHLLVESDRTFSLSVDEPVRFSRPSIDVLFESAAAVFQAELVGILLTGANNDGAAGIREIRKSGGLTIAQDPREAQYSTMPQAAVDTKCVNHIWSLSEIKDFLLKLEKTSHEKER
jgi:two-component system, chemotaxis family, protein-glutamate methylesterase/glutaminase